MDEQRRGSARKLWDIARRDLGLAEFASGHREEFANQIAFQCQQSAEKILKACLLAAGFEPPLTHSLRLLGDLLAQAGLPTPDEFDARFLSTFAVGPRYGGWEVSSEDALAAIEAAERVMAAYEPVLRRLLGESE
jgi:HEPN domain-containing protein